MIARVWHGWTTPALADTYEGLLRNEIFPGIFAKEIPGFLRIELFRRERETETEFMTVMWFASPDAVTAFVGEDHGMAYVPARAREVLLRFDRRAEHYEVRAGRDAPAARPEAVEARGRSARPARPAIGPDGNTRGGDR